MIFYVKAKWPWRYRSKSKVIVCDTPSHGSDHLWLIWKESIQNCRCYRADTAGGTDGRTDRGTEWNQYTPQQLRCSGGIIKFGGYNKGAWERRHGWGAFKCVMNCQTDFRASCHFSKTQGSFWVWAQPMREIITMSHIGWAHTQNNPWDRTLIPFRM